MSPSFALHSFFASNFPSLQADAACCLSIIQDNAKGLTTKSSVSEQRRLQDARRMKMRAFRSTSSSSRAETSSRPSRWESEVPALAILTASPPAPIRRQTVGMQSSLKEAPSAKLEDGVASPKIPRRRISLAMPYGSGDEALVMPLSSCLSSWWDNVEANTSISPSYNDIPEVKLRPKSWSAKANSPTSMESMMERGDKILVDSTNSSLMTSVGRKSNLKHAPRRPRRMKSMEPEDEISIDSIVAEEDPIRSSQANSIHSVLEHVKEYEGQEYNTTKSSASKLTSSEQIILKDSIQGVVASLAQLRRSTTSASTRHDLFKGIPADTVLVTSLSDGF